MIRRNHIFFVINGSVVMLFLSSYFKVLIEKVYLHMYKTSKSPGLYYCRNSSLISKILKKCPNWTSEFAIQASIEKGKGNVYRPTPWLLSRDDRTLIPFLLFFSPKNIQYKRRWVRCDLADGPSDDLLNSDDGGNYEAVALDCSFPMTPMFSASRSKVALLLLSGLTGGSTEEYLLDMVHEANKKGWICFVMIGV